MKTETLLLKPNDHHFVQLASSMGLDDFYNFFMHLGMTTIEYDGLNFRYFSNPLDFMLMGLFEWRNKTNLESTATFGKLQEALTAIKLEHYLCQVRCLSFSFSFLFFEKQIVYQLVILKRWRLTFPVIKFRC